MPVQVFVIAGGDCRFVGAVGYDYNPSDLDQEEHSKRILEFERT